MKLTDVVGVSGRATLEADGPVWNVATGDRVNASKGTSWAVVGTAAYDSPGEAGSGTSPGYMIVANAADHELHIVAVSRVTFVPAPTADCSAVKAELAIAQGRITRAITTLGGTP